MNVRLPNIKKEEEEYNFIGKERKKTVTSASMEELRAKLQEARKEIQLKSATIHGIQRNFDSLSMLLKNQKAQSIHIRNENATLKVENKEMQTKLKIYEQSVSQLRQQIALLQKKPTFQQELIEAKRRLSEIDKTLKHKDSTITFLQAQLLNKNQLKERLAQFTALQAKTIADHKHQIQQKDTQISNLRLQVSALEADVDRQKSLILNQTLKIKEIQTILDEKELALKKITERASEKELQLQNVEAHLSDSKSSLNLLSQQFQTLQNQSNSQKVLLSLSETNGSKNQENLIKMRDRIDELLEQQTLLKEELKDVIGSNGGMKQRLTLLQPFGGMVIKCKEMQENGLNPILIDQQVKANLDHRIAELELNLKQAEFKRVQQSGKQDSIEVQLSSLREELQKKESVNQSLWRDNKCLKSQYEKIVVQKGQLEDELNSTRSTNEKAMSVLKEEYAQQIRVYNEKIRELNAILQQKQQLFKALDAQAQGKSGQLGQQLKMEQLRLQESERQRNVLQDKLQKLSIKLLNQENGFLTKDEQSRKFKNKVDQHERQIDSLKKEVEFYLNRNKQLEGLVKIKADRTEEQVKRLKKEILFLEDRILAQQSDSLKVVKKLQQENDKLQDQNHAQELEVARLRSQLKNSKNNGSSKTQAEQELRSKCQRFEQLIKQLQQDLLEREKAQKEIRAKANETALENARIKLDGKFKAFKKILTDLSKGLQAVKMSLACNYCMERPKSAIRLHPCGHLFCEDCKDGYLPNCGECKSKQTTIYKDGSIKEVHSKLGIMEAGLSMFREEVEIDLK